MTYVVGIDPGPMVGMVGFEATWATRSLAPVVIQCSWNAFDDVLAAIVIGDTVIAVERFVLAPISSRANTPGAGRATRVVVERCKRYAEIRLLQCFERNAAEVKPWATDARLEVAGLLAPTKGMRHARDAARHALFAAVKDCGLTDPLSKRGGGAHG